MFRLLESGLPKAPVHLPNFKDLGYFINDEDEIRSIENPLAYFNYFVSKNERYNNLQRYAMNTAIKDEVLKRLEARGLRSMRLPIGVSEDNPHTTILVSNNLERAKRVIVLFYEHTQDLGVLAHRIIGGRGGINKGSAVCLVDYIQSLPENPSSTTKGVENSGDTPAIILANMGQLRWWRKGKQAVTQTTWYSVPRESAAHPACRFDEVKNIIPQNRNTEEHVACVFHEVLNGDIIDPGAKVEIIGVADGAYQVVNFLNRIENWIALENRLGALALLAPYHTKDFITNLEFASWLEKRGRAYAISSARPTTVLGSFSDPHSSIVDYGCPTFSLGEPYYGEVLLPRGFKIIIDFFQEVAAVDDYENPNFAIGESGEVDTSIHGYGGRVKTEKVGFEVIEHPNKPPHIEEASTTRKVQGVSGEDNGELPEGSVEFVESGIKLADEIQKPTTNNTLSEAEIEASTATAGEPARAANSESSDNESDAQKIESKTVVEQPDMAKGKGRENSDTAYDIVEGMKETGIQE